MFKDLLVNPSTLEIAPLDVQGALVDGLARRSTLKPAYLPTVRIRGQLRFRDRKARDGTGSGSLLGADISSKADAVVTVTDCARAGYEPRMGDRILCVIDKRGRADPVNLYVARADPSNELPGGFADWVLILTDRYPARASEN